MINVTCCVQSVLHLQPHTLEVSFATLQLLYQLCAGQAYPIPQQSGVVAKRPEIEARFQRTTIGNGLWRIEWSHDRLRHVTWKVNVITPKCLRPNISKTAEDGILQQSFRYFSLLWGSIRSAVPATAWLLIGFLLVFGFLLCY